MLTAARLFILSAIVLTGCRTAHNAAVTTFRVIDAPARYVRDRIDPDEGRTTTTTTQTTGVSDVERPGQPVTAPPQPSTTTSSRTTAETRTPSTSASPRPATHSTPRPQTTAATTPPKSTSTPRPSAPPAVVFPTARAVPGKPGFVYSIDPNGGMVDVTGYKSGDKAKDPYTHQVFIVP